MRVLITAGPAYGHLFPLLPLAGAARRAGHEVVIATGAELAPVVEERGFTVWPVGPSWAEAEAMRREVYAELPGPPSSQDRLRASAVGLFGAPAARRAAELVPRARRGALTWWCTRSASWPARSPRPAPAPGTSSTGSR